MQRSCISKIDKAYDSLAKAVFFTALDDICVGDRLHIELKTVRDALEWLDTPWAEWLSDGYSKRILNLVSTPEGYKQFRTNYLKGKRARRAEEKAQAEAAAKAKIAIA